MNTNVKLSRLILLGLLYLFLMFERSEATPMRTSDEDGFYQEAKRGSYAAYIKKNDYLSRLPVDIILHHIAMYLPTPTLLNLGMTSKQIHTVLDANILWEKFFTRDKKRGPLAFEAEVKEWKKVYCCVHALQRGIATLNVRPTEFKAPLGVNLQKPGFFFSYVQGVLAEMQNDDENAFQHYKTSAEGGYLPAQKRINKALYEGDLRQDKRSNDDRLQVLKDNAQKGDQDAQERIISALSNGALSYASVLPAERLKELHASAQRGESGALEGLNLAIYHGNIGYEKFSHEMRFQILLQREKEGDRHAQNLVSLSFYAGTLGQEERPIQDRFVDLKKRSEGGDLVARKWMYAVLCGDIPRHGAAFNKQCFQWLLGKANQGDEDAQDCIANTYYGGTFGNEGWSDIERFEALLASERRGYATAKNYIAQALYEGKMGPNKKNTKERFRLLLERAQAGERKAQSLIVQTFMEGKLHQKKSARKARLVHLSFILLRAFQGEDVTAN